MVGGGSGGVGKHRRCGGATTVGGAAKVWGGNECGERQQGWGRERRCGKATAKGGWAADARMSVVESEGASVLGEIDGKWGKAGDEPF